MEDMTELELWIAEHYAALSAITVRSPERRKAGEMDRYKCVMRYAIYMCIYLIQDKKTRNFTTECIRDCHTRRDRLGHIAFEEETDPQSGMCRPQEEYVRHWNVEIFLI